MATLKYKIIKSKKQYNKYCDKLEHLLNNRNKSKASKEEIELLTLLIEIWDSKHNSFRELDPVQLLKSLMDDRHMKPILLAQLLGISKGLVSDILNYKKGMSKEMIRKLAELFKVSQEAFNREYKLVTPIHQLTNKTTRKRLAM